MAAMTLRANQQHSSYLLFRSQIHSFRRSIVGVYFFIIIIIIIVKTILTGFLRLYATLRPFYHVIFDGKISLYCKPLICPSRDLSISDFTTCQILSYYLPMVCFFYQNCCFLCFSVGKHGGTKCFKDSHCPSYSFCEYEKCKCRTGLVGNGGTCKPGTKINTNK